MKFSALKVGLRFRFPGYATVYVKTDENKCKDVLGAIYSCFGYTDCIRDPKFQDSDVEIKTKEFEEVEVGTWFRYQRVCFMKIGPTRAREWGNNKQCYFRKDQLVEIATFEEVEK